MKKETMNTYNHNSKMDVNLFNLLEQNIGDLEFFLCYLKQKESEHFTKYLVHLEQNLVKLVTSSFMKEDTINFLGKLDILSQHISLFTTAIDAYLSICGFDYHPMSLSNQQTSVYKNDILRGMTFLRYYQAVSLLSIMNKPKAIQFTKDYVDYHAEKRRPVEKVDCIDDIIDKTDEWPALFDESFCLTKFKYTEGAVGYKTYKCRWHEMVKELKDPDFCYAAICHYDFRGASLMNEKFVLTRNQTLIQEKPYCDFVWHDKTIHKTCEHPDESFWEKL
ncbi:L-2-amino-thiazoline-4-carboxylic acid hydrolase [bacterium]|nr:L-2-amino-thiazoline-4-carboxylic acid hydrolase [bacterium]